MWVAGLAFALSACTEFDPGATGSSVDPNGSMEILVSDLTLVNADTDTDIQTLKNGDTIDLASVGTKLSIRANTVPSVVGSVRFGYDDDVSVRTENTAPYALAGDYRGDYRSWTPTVGRHTLTATPYSERSGGGTSGSALSISFTVTEGPTGSVNQPPTANPDTVSVQPGKTFVLDVLANDHDEDGDPLTIGGVTKPSHGDTQHDGKTISYTPIHGYSGSDSFDYTVEDGRGGTAQATVRITVLSEPGTSPITVSLVPNRTSGVAPLAVFFDATDTKSTNTVRPFHELLYQWNFGDPNSGTWATSKKSKNTATGGVSAHVYEVPGTYTVSLVVTDADGNTATESIVITVDDPNVVFGGEKQSVFPERATFQMPRSAVGGSQQLHSAR